MNDAGDMLGIKRYEPGFIERPYSGFYIRQDWLDKLGWRAPETIKDWYETLKAMKERTLTGTGNRSSIPSRGQGSQLQEVLQCLGRAARRLRQKSRHREGGFLGDTAGLSGIPRRDGEVAE